MNRKKVRQFAASERFCVGSSVNSVSFTGDLEAMPASHFSAPIL